MRRLILLTAFALITTVIGFGQVEKYSTYSLQTLFPNMAYGSGQIQITSDQRLAEIINGYIQHLAHTPIRGWRVQIYFGTGHNARSRANQITKQFQSKYPDIPTYIVFEQPYFKVRVGNFSSRRAAAKFLFRIKADFPKAFLTEDNIDVSRLTD